MWCKFIAAHIYLTICHAQALFYLLYLSLLEPRALVKSGSRFLHQMDVRQSSSSEANVAMPIFTEQKINPKTSRFPHCVVWTPIPCIT